MSVTKTAQTYQALNNLAKQREIISFAKKYGGEEGKLAVKEYKRFNIITLLIIFLVMIPMIVFTFFSVEKSMQPSYPDGATKEKIGHVSMYYDSFWYTTDDEQHKFNFSDLNIENDFEPGSKILIYLDDNDNIVSVAHEKSGADIAVKVLLMLVIPIVLLLAHAFVGRKLYAKNFANYCKWYEVAIAPHKRKANFAQIAENAKYQDVDALIEKLDKETLNRYKKYKRINMILTILFFVVFAVILFVYISLELEVYSVASVVFLVIYVVAFMIPLSIFESKIKAIKMEIFNKVKNF